MAMLGVETPRVAAEIRPLLGYSALFMFLTATSGLGFIAMIKKHPRYVAAQTVMWLSWILCITGLILVKT